MGTFKATLLVVPMLATLRHGASADDFMPNWMGRLGAVLGKQTFLDLTLPGTHDTMTYDLSHTISDGGIDDEAWLSSILNTFGSLGSITDFIQKQAQTQALTVSQQLDAGIRFLDFRVMFTAGDWRCLHMVQSNQKALTYLHEVRTWLDAHPTEIVAMWISKHGSECKTGNDQYPGVSQSTKAAFWTQIQGVFSNVLLDTSVSSLNGTAISDLQKRNHRAIIFASDFVEFTGGKTTLATDGCLVDNQLSMSAVDHLSLTSDLNYFAGIASVRAGDKKAGKFHLLSMANSPPKSVITDAAYIALMAGGTSNIPACAAEFHIPGMNQWCPESLLDVGQLTAYYKQLTLDAAFDAGYEFPNAIYIDAVGPGGVIRTGTRPLSSAEGSTVCNVYKWSSCQTSKPTCDAGWTANGDSLHWNTYDFDGKKHGFCGWAWQDHYKCCRNTDSVHGDDAYAYADTLIAVNVRRACQGRVRCSSIEREMLPEACQSQECEDAVSMMAARRARFPKSVWSDAPTGRVAGWPAAADTAAYV